MARAFYMVFVDGNRSPACCHSTLESACKEAQRLSAHELKTAWVLKAVAGYRSEVKTAATEAFEIEEKTE